MADGKLSECEAIQKNLVMRVYKRDAVRLSYPVLGFLVRNLWMLASERANSSKTL